MMHRFLFFAILCLPLSLSAQSAALPCDHREIQTTFSPDEHRYHHYRVAHVLGDTATWGSDPQRVFELLLSNKQYIAPCKRSVLGEVTQCSEMPVIIGIFRNEPIITVIDSSQFSIMNYSLPGHFLYPGYVERSLRQEGGNWVIISESEGTGRWPRIDAMLADRVWGGVVRKMRRGELK